MLTKNDGSDEIMQSLKARPNCEYHSAMSPGPSSFG